MNYLSGKVQRGAKPFKITTATEDSFSTQALELFVSRIKSFDCGMRSCFYNRQTGVLCGLIGYVSNLDALKQVFGIKQGCDLEVIESIYSREGFLSLYNALDGIFTAVVYDERTQEGWIFQDENGSNLPLYYALKNQECIFSTSLRDLLRKSSLTRKFNIQGVYDFLFYHFLFNVNMIPNDSTLIFGVEKLTPGAYLYIDAKQGIVSLKHLPRTSKLADLDKYGLMSAIRESIAVLCGFSENKNISSALSSGFDTNYLLCELRGLTEGPIKTFTIGGCHKNEIPVARAISRQYDNVYHIASLLSGNALNYLPNIVWKLEGYMFDIASFLQYELASQLSQEKVATVFLGDGADQVLDFLFYTVHPRINKQNWLNFLAKLYYIYYRKDHLGQLEQFRLFSFLRQKASGRMSMYMMLDSILKDGGLIQNSFHIQGLYPFMNRNVKKASRALGILNARKRFYKKEVRRLLPTEVRRHIVKIGGDTDIDYIFEFHKSRIIKKIRASYLINSLLGSTIIDQILNRYECYRYLLLLLLYLCLFEELFVSGKHDAAFDSADFKVPLEDFI